VTTFAHDRLHIASHFLSASSGGGRSPESLLKVCRILRIGFFELGGDAFRGPPSVVWIKPVVRVPERMHISIARVIDLEEFPGSRELVSIEIPIRPNLDAGNFRSA